MNLQPCVQNSPPAGHDVSYRALESLEGFLGSGRKVANTPRRPRLQSPTAFRALGVGGDGTVSVRTFNGTLVYGAPGGVSALLQQA